VGALLPSWAITAAQSRSGALVLYVIRRILWMIPVLFFVICITFVLMHLAPGSPWDKTGGRPLSHAVIQNLDAKYGLNKPLYQQFLVYLWNVVHFDFGLSYQYEGKTVTSLIGAGWPYTATLGVLAFTLIVFFGVGLGVLAALRQNTRIDYATMGFATLAASFPNFVIGAMMVVLFSVLLYKWTGGTFFLPSANFGLDDHLLMPVVTLSLLPTAYTARLTRASTLEVLRQDFVRTAWAKGLHERIVVIRHVLKNAMIPVVTSLGPTFALLVTGSVITEQVFNIPGIGRAFVTSVESYDYPMILGTTLLFAAVIAVCNLVVDLLYVFIDPRIKLT
jgi:oligopeptide transport system permease protein